MLDAFKMLTISIDKSEEFGGSDEVLLLIVLIILTFK